MNADLLFDVKVPPKKSVVAICGNCNAELISYQWHSYGYIPRLRYVMKTKYQSCPKCGVTFNHAKKEEKKPKWSKVGTNEYQAKVKDGDFPVWKHGYVWKSRYRAKGAKEPAWVETSFCVECAKGICEKNKKWVV